MAEILIDGDTDYESPVFTPCNVRIGGTIYEVAPRDDRAMEALLGVATDLVDADRAVEALCQCLSREDAREVRARLAEGEADDSDEDSGSRVTRGKLRFVAQKVILHYEDDIKNHFRALSRRANGGPSPRAGTPGPRAAGEGGGRPAARKKR